MYMEGEKKLPCRRAIREEDSFEIGLTGSVGERLVVAVHPYCADYCRCLALLTWDASFGYAIASRKELVQGEVAPSAELKATFRSSSSHMSDV